MVILNLGPEKWNHMSLRFLHAYELQINDEGWGETIGPPKLANVTLESVHLLVRHRHPASIRGTTGSLAELLRSFFWSVTAEALDLRMALQSLSVVGGLKQRPLGVACRRCWLRCSKKFSILASVWIDLSGVLFCAHYCGPKSGQIQIEKVARTNGKHYKITNKPQLVATTLQHQLSPSIDFVPMASGEPSQLTKSLAISRLQQAEREKLWYFAAKQPTFVFH